jgi:enoyl-CoA hydratase
VGETLRERLRIEAECVNRVFGTAALQEGVRQFLERDHPDRRKDGRPATPGIVHD